MTITIAERRMVGERAADDAGFRSFLMRDPHAAVEQALGRPVAADRRIEIVAEGSDWGFVMAEPAAMAAPLPDPVDVRTAAENHAYMLLRDEPALRDEAARDPMRFARERLDIEPGAPITVVSDDATSLKIVVPNREAREELSDDMLDMAGGGSGCNTGGKIGAGNNT